MEICNTVWRQWSKPFTRKRNARRQSGWGSLTNSWEKKRSKRQRRKGKIYQVNSEFQRRARRDKKTSINLQCKETEENNWMGKTRALVKKIRDTKGTFHAKIGTINNRNCKDQAKEIKKRWQEYTDEPYKKALKTQIIMTVWSLT